MASTTKKFRLGERKTIDDYPNLKKMLPPHYDYYFENYSDCDPFEGEPRFTASFRISQSSASKEEVRRWIDKFCRHSLTTYRIDRTYPSATTWYVYRVDLRCHHNTKPSCKRVRTPHKKHTGCPAKMIIKIRQARISKRKRHETHLVSHPIEVILYHHHNHLIQMSSILKYRDPDVTIVEKFRKMYKAGYKPLAALEIHKRDLLVEFEDNFDLHVQDRGICPDISWCYRQFDLTKAKYDSVVNLPSQTLQEYVCEYNKKCGGRCTAVKLSRKENDGIVIALLSPLMKSAHENITDSAKFMLIYSEEIEFLKCKIHVMMTGNGSYRLPLGALITSQNSCSSLKEALSLYAEMLPENGFGGERQSGPSVILVEDDGIQQDAFKETYPAASVLISPDFIVQKAWKYLSDYQCDISIFQGELIQMLKNMLCSRSVDDFEKWFEMIKRIVMDSPSEFFDYVKTIYARKHEVTVSLSDGMEMSRYAELVNDCFQCVQERYLIRNKACTVVEALECLANGLEEFYLQRICKLADGDYNGNLLLQYGKYSEVPNSLEIVPNFKLKNNSNGVYHDVDMKLGLCSCPSGRSGSPCLHKYALIQTLGLGSLLKCEVDSKKVNELRKVKKNTENYHEWSEDATNDAKLENSRIYSSTDCDNVELESSVMDNDAHDTISDDSTTTHVNVSISNVGCSFVDTQDDVQGVSGTSVKFKRSSGCTYNQPVSDTAKSPRKMNCACQICGKVLSSSAHLLRHQKLHNHGKLVVCDICGLGYKSKTSLEKHYSRSHISKRKLKQNKDTVHLENEHCGKSLSCMYMNCSLSTQEDLSNQGNDTPMGEQPNIILEVKNQITSSLQRQDIKEIIIIDTEGQLPFHE